MSMSYDDGNIPEIDFPKDDHATEVIPDEFPRRDGPGRKTTNKIPDEVPEHNNPEKNISGDIPQEIPQHGCPGRSLAYGQEAIL